MMLCHYEVSLAGPGHGKRGIPCQDSCAVQVVGDAVIAAVADGLGSETLSDVGSRRAADAAVAYCAQRMAGSSPGNAVESPTEGSERSASAAGVDPTAGVMTGMLRDAFYAAYDDVLLEAATTGAPADEMDSTLCVGILRGGTVYYGQSGDSGIVVAHDDGNYQMVTTMQRDDEGRVFPLCFDDRWVFGSVEGVSVMMLCTDGVLEDLIAPPILAKQGHPPVDTRIARGFLHPDAGDAQGIEALQADATTYLTGIPQGILDDDKTVVIAFDIDHLPANMPAPYYDGPDWESICRKAEAALHGAPPAADQEQPEDRG